MPWENLQQDIADELNAYVNEGEADTESAYAERKERRREVVRAAHERQRVKRLAIREAAAQSLGLVHRRCPVCGKPFVVGPGSATRRYDRDQCRREAYERTRRALLS